MNRVFCTILSVICLTATFAPAQTTLPAESGRPPVHWSHFPTPVHTLVWRNWECITAERLAKVLGTTAENVHALGTSMGLPSLKPDMDLHLRRNYISIIRRNWHLVPFDQLLTLLDWKAEHLAYTLREDDFLWSKLGPKPSCKPLAYVESDSAGKTRCAEIKAVVERHFADRFHQPEQPRFHFVDQLSKPLENAPIAPVTPNGKKDDAIRFLYSYFAVYGDPLMQPELDPYPEGLLQRLAAAGVNGVWLHTVLRQISPATSLFPEFGEGHETRLANLRKMVDRAAKYGINLYLYMNEPRAMPPAFFKNRPELAGVPELDHVAVCTSVPEVRQWLSDSLTHVFREVPKLGGIFIISASENMTNCASHYQHAKCPRCSKRPMADVFAEVVQAMSEGVHRGRADAKVIAWDWGWQDNVAPDVIKQLPKDVYLMSVSEWSKPFVRGGIAGQVGEYSMSVLGPGPRAQKHWALAKERGLKTIAKVQVNCTWELSAMPYLPVMNLVAHHCNNLTTANTDGLMLSWTLGGYPSPNLEIVKYFFGGEVKSPTIPEALTSVATARYGQAALRDILQAWGTFSEAFTEFPYDPGLLYLAPMQVGPANPLYLKPTGYVATMVGIPYDALDHWRGPYPAAVFADQFSKIASGWQNGLSIWREAIQNTPTGLYRTNLEEDLRLAEAAYLHFKSVANQAQFTIARNALAAATATAPSEQKDKYLTQMKEAVEDEILLASHLYTLTRQDARIGYEATNHYYYLPLDLVEKIVNCTYIRDHELTQ